MPPMVCKNADIFHLFLAEADHLFYLKTTKTNKKIFEALTEMIFHRVSLSSLMFITFSLQSVCLLEAVQTLSSSRNLSIANIRRRQLFFTVPCFDIPFEIH